MWPVKPAMNSIHIQSNRPAVPIQVKKSKIVPQEDAKNCRSKKYNKAVCADKKCQATMCYKKVDKNCQTTNMWPVKPAKELHNMQSVTSLSNMKSNEKSSFKQKNSVNQGPVFIWMLLILFVIMLG